MPLQNRVLPTGEIVSDPARGLLTGNRGIIHRPGGTLGVSRWSHKHWLVCTLTHPKGHYHGPMPDRGWTALFFLDEAVALSAGHRPCHFCRRAAYHAFIDAWTMANGPRPGRTAMDGALHRARVTRSRAQVRHEARADSLPDHAFVLIGSRAHMILGDRMLPWSPRGYEPAISRPNGSVSVLSPRPMLGVLRAGYNPILHPSAHT